LAFVLFRFVGDPVNQMVGQDTSIEDRLKLRQELGLDDPIALRYLRWLLAMLHGDWGFSFASRIDVDRLPAGRFGERIVARLFVGEAAKNHPTLLLASAASVRSPIK
jgi:ABC-type dipeptide/oligopeptide/nickel transport system permease component